MLRKFQVFLIVAPLMLVATQLSASPMPPPVWSVLNPASPGFTYTVFPADGIRYFNGNIMNQSSANIETVIETQFGLSNDLTPVSQCDSPTSGCTGATGGASGGTNTYSSILAFNYLAIHFGQAELLFYWDNPINNFSFTDPNNNFKGLSNYRAYSDGLSAVPLPAAGWLFGSALFGLMGLRRKMQ